MTIICWSLGIMGCAPDSPAEPEYPDYPFTFEGAVPAADVEQAIEDFKAYLEGSELHKQESMHIDDVVWSVEATLNQTYTNLAHNFEQLHTRKDTIEITHSADMMNSSEVQGFYNEALAKFSEHFHTLPEDNRLPVLVDVATLEAAPNSLVLTTQIGTGSTVSFVLGFHDEWWWDEYGMCEDGILHPGESDAAEEIENQLNSRVLAINNLGITPCYATTPPICHSPWFAISVESSIFVDTRDFLNTNDDIPGDNYRDFLLYDNSPTNFYNEPNLNWADNLCLDVSEMDFYFNSAVEIININKPPSKSFVCADLKGDAIDYNVNQPFLAFHTMTISYGTVVTSPVSTGASPPGQL